MIRLLSALALASVLSACGGAARPVADPGPERTVSAGEEVAFDGSASRGDIDSYRWDFGDGSDTATGATAAHTFTTEGDYSVSLTVRGPGGTSTAAAVVHVGKGCLPAAVLDVITADPQPGAPIQLSAGNSTPCAGQALATYSWDFGDGTTASGADKAQVEHTFADKGTYSLALEVFDARGAKGRATRTLNVGLSGGKPIVQCAGPTSATAGTAAQYTAQGSDPGGSALTYDWTFSDDGATPQGASVSHTFATAGSFTATVVATTTDSRQSDPCTVNVTVTAPLNYSGTWLMNPSSASLTGCSKFTVGFPATYLALTHSGTSMTATPSGNSWPANHDLTGMEDTNAPGTYRVRGSTPQEDKTSAGCGPVTPDHSVSLTFTGATTVSGTWTVIYNFACVGNGCSASCNCVASGTFTAKKQ